MRKINSLMLICFLALSWQLSAQISTFPYAEDFEASDGGYVTTGTSSTWAHGTPAGSVITSSPCGTQAWVTNLTGNYNNSENSQLESPVFDFTGLASDPVLRFDHIYETEGCCDEGWVEVSTNAGATWTKLGTSASGIANWYNDGGNDWWDGSSSGWRVAMHTMTGLAGQDSIKFRFNISSDGSVSRDGFAVDNIVITTTGIVDPVMASFTRPSGTLGAFGSTDTIEVNITNSGSAMLTTVDLCYVLDGNAAVCQTFPLSLAVGASIDLKFTQTANLSATGAHTLASYIQSANDVVCNDTINTSLTTTLIINSFPYIEDFEAGAGDWSASGTSSTWAHGVPAGSVITSSAGCGTQAWVTNLTGNYNNSENSQVVSPTFDFSGLATDPIIRFDHIYETEGCCDEGWVEVSTDGGASWNKLGTSTSGISNWYNDGGNNWWDGSSSGWRVAAHTLTGLAGQANVKIRFNISTDGSVSREGFAVDNIIVFESLIDPLAAELLQPAVLVGGLTATETVEMSVTNAGTTTLTSIQLCYVVDGGTPVCETFTTNIAALATDSLTFAATADFSVGGAHTLDVYVGSMNDYLCNDSLSANLTTILCPIPTTLSESAMSSTGATLSWVTNGTATQWEVRYDTTGVSLSSASTSTIVNTDTFLAVTGLNAQTSYQWYVREVCGVGDTSSWSSTSIFTTPCAVFTAPYTMDFEASMTSTPNCWTQTGVENWLFRNTGTGHIGSQGTINGSTFSNGYFAWVDDSSPHNGATTIESPFIDISGLTTPRLTFYTLSDNENDANGNVDFHVDVFDGTAWNDSLYFSDTNSLINAWEQIIVDLSGITVTGPIQVRFVVDENNGSGFDDDRAIDDVVVEETPSCLATTVHGTANLSFTSVDLTWVDNSGASSWEVEWDTAGFTQGTGNSIITATNPHSLSGLTASTDYDWYVRAICLATDTGSWSGINTFFTGYCTPAPSSTDGSGITNVTFSTVNNTGPIEPNYYGDYSAMVGDIAQGTTVSLDITYATGFTYGTKVWIDWNDDLDFDDVGEEVYVGLSTNANPTTLAATFTVPLTTPLGQHRMRIGGADNNAGPTGPCYTGSFGSFEDYTVNVTLPPACLPPTSQSTSAVSFTGATLSWVENGTATQWEVEYDTAGFTLGTGTSTIVNADTFLVITGLTASTSYDWHVKAICGPADSSGWVGANTFFTGYCTPNPTSVDGIGITNVSFGTVNNTTAAEAGNYGDYSAMIGNIQQTTTAVVDITLSTGFTYGTKIWIDWNNDLDFIDAGEEVYFGLSTTGNPTTLNATFTVPATASLGQHRMRIGGADNNLGVDPCYTGAWSSFEDYTVNVLAPPSCIAPTAHAASLIAADSALVAWLENGTAILWEVEYDTTGFTLGTGISVIQGLDTTLALTGLTAATTYDYYVRSICGSNDTSAWTIVRSFTTLCPPLNTPVVLPFVEDWEGNTGTQLDDGSVGCGPTFSWDFDTNDPAGRARYGADAEAVSNGTGAITLDRSVSGAVTINHLILTLDMSSYTTATDLELIFDYRHHGEENHPNDSLWIRGDTGSAWVGVYDLYANRSTSFITVGPIDVDAALTAAGQTVSSTFQVRFGQEDNFPTPSDGFSFDDITLRQTPACLVPTVNMASAIATDSADVSWIENGTATAWEVEYGTSGFTPGSGTTLLATDTFITISGLTAA
ncbi:MAG: immune inhibitor A, partial [Flavobacteriales bacterium]|nr:immune inhibitor A [Flavobacteriales bacterium]